MGFVRAAGAATAHALSARVGAAPADADRDARTAIVMPICNEDVATVFAGLRATCESLAATGAGAALRLSSCSPTRTDPRLRAAELARLERPACRARARRRRRPVASTTAGGSAARSRKAGNVADFCRRWGARLPLHGRARRRQRDERRLPVDAGAADGGASARRHHPDRAARRAASRRCTRASQQFAGARVRAAVHRRHALLAARRVALLGPQRDHPRRSRSCSIARWRRCRARRRSAGDILSHDFVEAALMRRAGWRSGSRTTSTAATSRCRRTCSPSCSATGAGARATCRTRD